MVGRLHDPRHRAASPARARQDPRTTTPCKLIVRKLVSPPRPPRFNVGGKSSWLIFVVFSCVSVPTLTLGGQGGNSLRKTSLHAGVKLCAYGWNSKITASGLGSFAVARAELVAIHLKGHSFTQDQLQALPAKVIIERQ